MVQLDYQTINPRWGLRGIKFSNWQNYSFILGYLSNPAHNYELHHSLSADISMRIERNDKQGAWNKEGRIHFYGQASKLGSVLKDLYDHSSKGVGRVTKRIDSNGYILSLIDDYGFELCPRTGYTTADVFPPNDDSVVRLLEHNLLDMNLPNDIIDDCLNSFDDGFNF